MASKTKYLYLTEIDWAKTWVEGGIIPIKLASTYKSDIRDKTQTPDENLQRNLTGISESDFKKIADVGDKAKVNIVVGGKVIIAGEVKGEKVEFNQFHEDGLILSFCNSFDPEIAARLGKAGCVEISDIYELFEEINKQLGIKGFAQDCIYTDSFERNHFLKSTEDKWQNEFRMFWPHDKNMTVTLKKHTAKEISIL